jgi:hypothetical protein
MGKTGRKQGGATRRDRKSGRSGTRENVARTGIAADRGKYLISLADELLLQADRVRNLIGPVHWPTDGHHKEALLISLLTRHLPTAAHASRGFVVSSFDDAECSGEQDILVVDTSVEAPLFDQGGVAIAIPDRVIACISVKTTLTKATLVKAIKGLDTVTRLRTTRLGDDGRWYGIYFFAPSPEVERSPELIYEYMRQGLVDVSPDPDLHRLAGLDFLCCGRDLAVKPRTSLDAAGVRRISQTGYRCSGLATALFLADLLDHIAARRGSNTSGLAQTLDSRVFQHF